MAWQIFSAFSEEFRLPETLSFSQETFRAFATWCDGREELRMETIESYVHSLSKIKQLLNLPPIPLSKFPILKPFLQEAKNIPNLSSRQKTKKACELPLSLGSWGII